MARLIVKQPGQKAQEYEISDGVTSIGRAHGNAVRLWHDRNVSRSHAIITHRDDGYWFNDLTTRNGTSINGNLVRSEQKLAGGDVICLGGTSTIEFSEPEISQHSASEPTNTETSAPVMPSTADETQSKPGVSVMLLGIAGGVAVIALFGAILLAAGAVKWNKSKEVAYRKVDPPPQEIPSPSSDDIEETATPAPEVVIEKPNDEPPPGPKSFGAAEAAQAQILAAKISPKNYKFDPAFIALIAGYVNEYKSAAGYHARARTHRDAIDREFVNVQGVPPLFGYGMAMSRTKFIENNRDVWGLPDSILKTESASVAGDSTKIAASYIRGLWDVFGKEGFMYVVACYGMTLDQAGAVQQQIELKDPGGQARYDFWQMKNMGVVKGEQVERVARFFAAGIVIENPQQFGLNEPPVSTLF